MGTAPLLCVTPCSPQHSGLHTHTHRVLTAISIKIFSSDSHWYQVSDAQTYHEEDGGFLECLDDHTVWDFWKVNIALFLVTFVFNFLTV